MEIQIYKTFEISDDLWDKIVLSFNESFEQSHMTKKDLISGATSDSFGYSYHAVCVDNDRVVGFNSIIPNYYFYNKQKIKMGYSGSTFVIKEYRKNMMILRDMMKKLEAVCKEDDIKAFLAVPNSNSLLYFRKILKYDDIANLPYYILPVSISKILKKPGLKIFDFFIKIFCTVHIFLNKIFASLFNTRSEKKKYAVDYNTDFNHNRFSHSRYKTIQKDGVEFSYAIYNEDGVKTAYLMDFHQNYIKSRISLIKSISHIYRNEDIDAILFIGTMNFFQTVLCKVPAKYEPKNLPLTVKILNKQDKENFVDYNKINNWDFSLINFDVR